MSGQHVERVDFLTHLEPICCNYQRIDKEKIPLKFCRNYFVIFLLDTRTTRFVTLSVTSIDEETRVGYNQDGQVYLIEVHCE
jgi:hypothetical protein